MASSWHDLIPRDLLPFPEGNNDTDTVFGGVHFNLTTLKYFNYTYYSNRTVSNGSRCYLTFQPYQPVQLFTNGSFLNATKCYVAIEPMGPRALTGMGVAVAFGISLVLLLTALGKHGKLYLPKDRRFYPIGRRWQWYWGSFVCAAALISGFTNIDVDRYYIVELPIIVTCFFWFLLCQGTTALVWEAVRHWGSWQERQYVDPDPFIYSQDDRRSKVEFYLPLWFYFWLWMNFFMVVPRSWSFAKQQRSIEQTEQYAIPNATSIRFKIGAFCLFICWVTIVFSLYHSILYYKPRHGGVFSKTWGFVSAIPRRFVLLLPLLLGTIGYQAAISFWWDISIFKKDGPVPIIYGWGYGPSLAILWVQIIYGISTMNEDKQIIRQRRIRGDTLDRELGIGRKPAWWKRVRGDHLLTMRDKMVRNVQELGNTTGGRVGRREENDMERHAREEAERNAVNTDGIELQGLMHSTPGATPASEAQRELGSPRLWPQDTDMRSTTMEQALGSTISSKTADARARRAWDLMQDGPPVAMQMDRHGLAPNREGDARARRAWELMQDGPPSANLNDGASSSVAVSEADRRAQLAWSLMQDGPPPAYDDGRTTVSRPRPGDRSSTTSSTGSLNAPPQVIKSMLDV